MEKKNLKTIEKQPKAFLAETIRSISEISEINLQKILDVFETVKCDKNTQIIKEGEITSYVYFVTKGIVKIYYHSSGKELIDWFAEEGTFIGNLYSHIMQKPGFDIYESIEDVILLRAKYSDLELLFKKQHEIESTARKVLEQYYVKYVERVHHLKGLPADEKYHLFQQHYGGFVNRIPLKYVADYLGITSETLSRIRGKDNKKIKKRQ